VQKIEEIRDEKDLLKSPEHLTKINQNWQTLNLHQLHQLHNLKKMPQDDEQLNKRMRNKMFISLGEISIPCNINILTNPLKICHKIGCLSKHYFNFLKIDECGKWSIYLIFTLEKTHLPKLSSPKIIK